MTHENILLTLVIIIVGLIVTDCNSVCLTFCLDTKSNKKIKATYEFD